MQNRLLRQCSADGEAGLVLPPTSPKQASPTMGPYTMSDSHSKAVKGFLQAAISINAIPSHKLPTRQMPSSPHVFLPPHTQLLEEQGVPTAQKGCKGKQC